MHTASQVLRVVMAIFFTINHETNKYSNNGGPFTMLNLKKSTLYSIILFLIISFSVSSQDHELLCDFENLLLDSIKTEDSQISFFDTFENRSLEITFGSELAMPKVTFDDTSIGNKVWDFSEYVYVTAEVENLDLEKTIEVFGYFNNAIRGNGMVIVPPQQKAILKVPICRTEDYLEDEIKKHFGQTLLGLPGGFMDGFSPMPDSIHTFTIHAIKLNEPHTIRVDNIKVETPFTTNLIDVNTMNNFIDEFGQYEHMPSEFKTDSIGEMSDQIDTENLEFKNHPGSMEWNKFGGWANGPQLDATGHFRVDTLNGKWWMVDPEGRLFWSSGINAVGEGMETMLNFGNNDYSHYFQKLPDSLRNFRRDDTLGVMADFYTSNIINKYENKGTENWKLDVIDNIQKRMRSWGINTLGLWSNYELCKRAQIPYTVHIKSGFKPIEPDHVKDEAGWEKIKQGLSDQYQKFSESFKDPFCVGFFIDNEMYFRHFNDAENTDEVIDRYYAMCDTVHDEWNEKEGSNKLNLGSRVHFYKQYQDPKIVKQISSMAKYCDVISLNRYSYTMRDLPALKDINPDFNKPLIIGEFHFGALDRGLAFTGLRFAQDQDQRAEMYKLYMKECLEHENIVGAHWFKYSDRPFTACKGGENAQMGFVDICDMPYKELVEASRDINYQLYDIRYGTNNCSDYESWYGDQWLNYEVGHICERDGIIYKCINAGQSHRDPSGIYGHFGWTEIGQCMN